MDDKTTLLKIQNLLENIEGGKGTAEDIEKIRRILLEWDEYANWGADR